MENNTIILDGKALAEKLKNQLKGMGYNCFIVKY